MRPPLSWRQGCLIAAQTSKTRGAWVTGQVSRVKRVEAFRTEHAFVVLGYFSRQTFPEFYSNVDLIAGYHLD